MKFSTGRVTDTLLTIVTASLVVLGVASTQSGSSGADLSAAPLTAAARVAPEFTPGPAGAVLDPDAGSDAGTNGSSAPAPAAAADRVDPGTEAGGPLQPADPRPAAARSAAAEPGSSSSAASRPASPEPAMAQPAQAAALAAVSGPSSCSGPDWQQRRGEAALSSLRPAQPPGYPVTFKSAMKGFYGLTKPAELVIEVYVRDCSSESDALLRHVVAHEIGHAWDKTWLTDAQRTAWLAARGVPAGTRWQGCDRCTDFATPAGDFAEVYAQWRRGAIDNRSQLAGAPGPAALDALAREFFGA